MNTSRTRILLPWLLVLMFVLLNGCAEQKPTESVRIKRGTPPEIIAVSGKAKTIPGGFIKRRLRLGFPSIENFIINDRQYIHVTEKWFYEVLAWTEEFIALQVPSLDLNQEYPVAYNETFVSLASNVANISVARRYNVKGSVLIGLITAKGIKPWGKIPADGKYRVYLIGLTEDSGIVYDIRTKQSIEFSKFPNIDSIKGVMF